MSKGIISFISHAFALGVIVTVVFFLLAGVLAAEAPSEEWNRTYGGGESDGVYSVQETTDGGYILAGYTESYGAGDNDAWLIKTDYNGNEEWNRTYGGGRSDRVYSVQETTSGGYILAGDTYSFGTRWGDGWLIKTDSNGVEEWNRTYGDQYIMESASSVLETKDGGYILLSYSDFQGSLEEGISPRLGAWLIKTDPNGDEEWIKKYGCVDLYDDVLNIDEGVMYVLPFSTVQETSDGGYVFTASRAKGRYMEGQTDAVLVKIEPETSTPGFEILTGLASAAVIAAVIVFRRKRE